jgi:hypothetical protein
VAAWQIWRLWAGGTLCAWLGHVQGAVICPSGLHARYGRGWRPVDLLPRVLLCRQSHAGLVQPCRLICCVVLQGLASQQGINWDDVKRAAEASQHATQVAAQQAQQPAAAGGCMPCSAPLQIIENELTLIEWQPFCYVCHMMVGHGDSGCVFNLSLFLNRSLRSQCICWGADAYQCIC